MPVNQPTLSLPRKKTRLKQRGASAIEFALVFPIFFALFYAIVGYSLVMTLQQSMTQASKDGIRAAIKADPTQKGYVASAKNLAQTAVTQALQGLPEGMRSHIKAKVDVAASNITVELSYPYSENPIIPVLKLPLIGKIPDIPNVLKIQSNGQL